MLSHSHSILVELALVSWVNRGFFVIHRVIASGSAAIGSDQLSWGQICTLSHVIVRIVVTGIFEIIDWCKIVSVWVLSLNVHI